MINEKEEEMFEKLLSACNNIYDIFIACYIQIKDKDIPYEKARCNHEETSGCIEYINAYIERESMNDATAFDDLKSDIKNYSKSKNMKFCDYFGIMDHIDNRYRRRADIETLDDYISYKRLNTVFSPDYILLPVIKNTFIEQYNEEIAKLEKGRHRGLRKRWNRNNGSINDELENLVIFEHEKQLQFEVHIYNLIADSNTLFFSRSRTDNSIPTLMVPMLCADTKALFNIRYSGEDKKLFEIEHIQPEFKERIKNTFKVMLEPEQCDKADVVIFPEFFMTDIDPKEMIEIIDGNDYEYDKLFFLGTKSQNHQNNCHVITSNGSLLFRQSKKTPYEDKNGAKENLSKRDNIINIIDVNGFGRIATLICRDAMNANIESLIRDLKVGLVIITAYSPSLEMKSIAEDLAKRNHCFTIMCNSCAALKRFDGKRTRIGYITFPAKKQTNATARTYFYSNDNNKCDECEMCSGIFVTIKYDNIVVSEEYTGMTMM